MNKFALFSLIILAFTACKQTPKKVITDENIAIADTLSNALTQNPLDTMPIPEPIQSLVEAPPKPYDIVVNQNGDITLGGKKVAFDDLKNTLTGVLVKEKKVPTEIPVKYEGEVLMGMRSEVGTFINEAITDANLIKNKPKTSPKPPSIKKNTIAPVAYVSVDKGGNVKVKGKKTAFDDVKKELQTVLAKENKIPNQVPIVYEEKMMMGFRQELETQVDEAIAGAKWIKKKNEVEVTSKSPKSLNLMVSKKGNMTLGDKAVTLESLKKDVQTALAAYPVIPNEIPIKYDYQPLMGMRHEVDGEVLGGISRAKWVRKKAALETLQKPIEKRMTIPVQFEVISYNTSGTFAYVAVDMKHKNGKAMDFKGTPFEKQYRLGGSISSNVMALMKYENGAWKILTYELGPTDVPFINWAKEYKAPSDIFPKI